MVDLQSDYQNRKMTRWYLIFLVWKFQKLLIIGNKTAPTCFGHKGKATVLNGYKRKSAKLNSSHGEFSFFCHLWFKYLQRKISIISWKTGYFFLVFQRNFWIINYYLTCTVDCTWESYFSFQGMSTSRVSLSSLPWLSGEHWNQLLSIYLLWSLHNQS